jgi:mRNA interferase RelE/StbE
MEEHLAEQEANRIPIELSPRGIRQDGSKKDAYALAKKLLKLGLFDEPETD